MEMNIFTWLLMGHFLGDWLLQNDWMARSKKQGWFTLGGWMHFAIYTTTTVGAFWLGGIRDRSAAFYLVLGGVIFVSHWLIDAMDGARRWMRLYRQSDLEMVRVVVDQTLHLLVLTLLALFSFGDVK
jgi:hypothetical protein